MSGGCTRYIKASVTIYFPDGHLCCNLCPLMETYARKQCRRTGEYLLFPETQTGVFCPLKMEGGAIADEHGELHE